MLVEAQVVAFEEPDIDVAAQIAVEAGQDRIVYRAAAVATHSHKKNGANTKSFGIGPESILICGINHTASIHT